MNKITLFITLFFGFPLVLLLSQVSPLFLLILGIGVGWFFMRRRVAHSQAEVIRIRSIEQDAASRNSLIDQRLSS